MPIIFVTAISKEPHHVFRGYSAGAVDYLFKPFDPVVLRSKVEVFVECYERGRALAEREELLRATFEDAPIGMARADADGSPAPGQPGAVRHDRADLEADLVGLTLDELGPRARRAWTRPSATTCGRAHALRGRAPAARRRRHIDPGAVSVSLARAAATARGPT